MCARRIGMIQMKMGSTWFDLSFFVSVYDNEFQTERNSICDVKAKENINRYLLNRGNGHNTDPQSMNYPSELPDWTTLKWTTPKNNNPNEYYLMFLAASIIKVHITSAYVHPLQPLATSLNILYLK